MNNWAQKYEMKWYQAVATFIGLSVRMKGWHESLMTKLQIFVSQEISQA